jgi:hypothetical protein
MVNSTNMVNSTDFDSDSSGIRIVRSDGGSGSTGSDDEVWILFSCVVAMCRQGRDTLYLSWFLQY